jgi:N-acetylglucosamine kinase-like BadF-type ATPase
MALVVGVDGGSTKTVAVVSDPDGTVRGVGRGGGSNPEGMGFEEAAKVIAEVTEHAVAMTGGEPTGLVHGHLGLSGVDWPGDGPSMAEALEARGWRFPIAIENDAFLPLRACAPEGYGIGVAAGGGICCGIIRPDGETYFYGAFTDLGGGIDIAAQVLHAVLRSEDGRGESTALTPALLAATGHETVVDLAYSIHREGKYVSKRTTDPVLFGCAAKGDPAAVDIVTRFGRQLALCATNLVRRYGLQDEDPAVVSAGSLFMKTGPLLFEVFSKEVLEVAPRARLMLADLPPVIGAVRGALAAAGRGEREVWERLRETAAESGWFREDVLAAREGSLDDE